MFVFFNRVIPFMQHYALYPLHYIYLTALATTYCAIIIQIINMKYDQL